MGRNDRWAPDALEHEGFGAGGDALLILMELRGELVDGGAPQGLWALVQTWDARLFRIPTEGGEVGAAGFG